MNKKYFWLVAFLFLLIPAPAEAMHISEGILPAGWAVVWYAVAIPFIIYGLHSIRCRSKANPEYKALLGLIGAAVFIISCLPIPVPIAGTCAHPCGTALAAIILGPGAAVVISSVALLFQALFLAHGGLSTLGANITAMGIVGGFVGYGVFHAGLKFKMPLFACAFIAALLAHWATYATTALELATALHGDASMWGMFGAIAVAFLPTQIPIGIFEGIITGLAVKFMLERKPELKEQIITTRLQGVER